MQPRSFEHPRKPGPWLIADTSLLTALALFTAACTLLRTQWHGTPIEDAAMLLRYAQHVAQGYGIRWNIHQAPVDGATDLLYTVAIGMLARLANISVLTASRCLNIAAHIFSVALVYAGGRWLLGGARWLCATAALYLAVGPALAMADGGFGAPCFAALLLACWCAGLHFAARPNWPSALLMATLGLLAGLTRPEGVLVAFLLLAATMHLTQQRRLTLLLSFLLLFGTLGTAYFAWRWRYFGYPLPNPFYIKGNGHMYPDSVRHAAVNLLTLLMPFLPLLPLGWLSPATRRLATALAGLLLSFTLMWVLLNNANNHFARFQYAIVPVALMTLPALANGLSAIVPNLWTELWSARTGVPTGVFVSRVPLTLAATLFALLSLLHANHLYLYNDSFFGMRAFAERLQPFANRGYTMAVTEAGVLPLYSQWNAIDGLGLNDAFIAHQPDHHLTTAYLDRFHPEIITTHIDRTMGTGFAAQLAGDPPTPDTSSYNQALLSAYARSHGYTLAAVWGADQCNLHVYWLRPGFPDYAAVLSAVRDHPYNFLDNGFLSHDYRNDLDSTQLCGTPEVPRP